LMLIKLPYPTPASAAQCAASLHRKLLSVTEPLRLRMTYDQGREMAIHKNLSKQIGMTVYFCDPHSPWQRGSNENTNGLVRQCLPKEADLSIYS
jgi:IS30 family transposase